MSQSQADKINQTAIALIPTVLSGNKEEEDKAFATIVKLLEPLTFRILNHYNIPGKDMADRTQDAMVLLRYTVIPSFDATKGRTFVNFYAFVIKRRFISKACVAFGKTRYPHKRRILSIDALTEDDRSDSWHPADTDTANDYNPSDYDTLLDLLLHNLSEVETKVALSHIEGKSYDETALECNLNEKQIDNALQRIRFKFARAIRNSLVMQPGWDTLLSSFIVSVPAYRNPRQSNKHTDASCSSLKKNKLEKPE